MAIRSAQSAASALARRGADNSLIDDWKLRGACNDGGAEPQAGRIDATAGGHHVRAMTDPSTARSRFVLCLPRPTLCFESSRRKARMSWAFVPF